MLALVTVECAIELAGFGVALTEDDSGDDGSMSGGNKWRIDKNRLPWHKKDLAAQEAAGPIVSKNLELLEYFGRNIPHVKQMVILSPSAPAGIPPSEIKNALRGLPLNLDILFSALHHLRPPKENVCRIRDSEIRFDATKPAQTVKTANDWTAAWYPTRKLYAFIFPHREDEATTYGDYITEMFTTRVASAHQQIILYDKGVRNLVQGGQCHLLTDYHSFTNILAATVQADRIKYNSSASFPKTNSKSGATFPPCHRFNSGNCPNTSQIYMY